MATPPPAFPEPLRSRRPWRSSPTAPVQPPRSRAGAALGTREEPWGGAVGGACSPAGGAGGVLPGGGAKILFVFPIRLGDGVRAEIAFLLHMRPHGV